MKEYIERDAVLGHKRKMRGFDLCEEFWDEAVLCEVIEKLPTADVAPVVHGEWIERSDKGILNMRCPYMCNICGRVEELKEPYCNCGAKMDGGKK